MRARLLYGIFSISVGSYLVGARAPARSLVSCSSMFDCAEWTFVTTTAQLLLLDGSLCVLRICMCDGGELRQ